MTPDPPRAAPRSGPVGRAVSLAVAALVSTLVLGGCATGDDAGEQAPGTPPPAAVVPPAVGFPVGARFDYQLGGAYPPAPGVAAVVRDSAAPAAPGLFSVCYVNAFQSQPEDRDAWLDRHPDLVLRGAGGVPVSDPGWPGEMVLDTSTPATRDGVVAVVRSSIERCGRSGYQAVELDNLDSFTRSGGALTVDDNLATAAALVAIAHERHLLVGQKNAAEQSPRGRAAGFDFAVTEECLAFDECGRYRETYGDATLDVEYAGTPCAVADRPRSTTLRDRQLVTPGTPGYVIDVCAGPAP